MTSVLTIGGSDSAGCAGIQADMKTFSFLGLHGSSAITCVTAQSTKRINSVYKIPLKIIELQIDTVLADLDIRFIKTGMLYSKDIVRLVSDKITAYNLNAVVDPVMVSTTNFSLYENDLAESLRKYLIPKATVFMPNLYEAGKILDAEIRDIDDMKKACKRIKTMGCKYVLLKGGHLRKHAVDILFNGKKFMEYSAEKINAKAHGSGCTYSALITGLLAKGFPIDTAVEEAKKLITKMISLNYKPGKGVDVVNQYAMVEDDIERYKVLKELKTCVEWLEKNISSNFTSESPSAIPRILRTHVSRCEEFTIPKQLIHSVHEYIPEVGINFVYALPNARALNDICGIEGRLVKVGNSVRASGAVDFGMSKHVATIVLTAMRYDKSARSALNLRYTPEILRSAEKKGMKISSFDRREEPKEEKVSTMEWGTESAIKKAHFVPDIIYDKGAVGKEPMIRLIGKSPTDVLKKLKLILKQ